jgi:hypothetical protein
MSATGEFCGKFWCRKSKFRISKMGNIELLSRSMRFKANRIEELAFSL